MKRPCPDPLRFLNIRRQPASTREPALPREAARQADAGSASHEATLGDDVGAAVDREHLENCSRCQEELAALRHIQASLTALRHAEGAAAPVDVLWNRIESRLESPGTVPRLPLPLAGVTRLVQEALKPAVATAWAAGVAGLLLGMWLAPRSPEAAEDSYAWSSLVEGSSLAATYESSFTAEETDASPDVLSDDSSGVAAPNGSEP